VQLGVVEQIHSLLLRPLSGISSVVPSLATLDVLTDRPTHHGHNTASIQCLQTGFYWNYPIPKPPARGAFAEWRVRGMPE
jgi:hypothetical protein